MPTIVTLEDGKKKHICDEGCQRICDRCQESWTVHGMWQWAMRTFLVPARGGGGLLCDDCANAVLGALHSL